MSKVLNTALVIIFSVATSGVALADTAHHDAAETDGEGSVPQVPATMNEEVGSMGMMGENGPIGQMGMMQGNPHQMMQGMMKMMMQMHGGVMGGASPMGPGGGGMMGGMMGSAGPMGPGSGAMNRMSMMDQDMMSFMRGPMMDRLSSDMDGDGAMSIDAAHRMLQAMHADADTNGDASLSLEEFEALHVEMTRGLMVDRFQHLDADGDGMVAAEEMTAPADRSNMRLSENPMMGGEADMSTSDN